MTFESFLTSLALFSHISSSLSFDHSLSHSNPVKRTGITGRGNLPRWGPNQLVLPIITRWFKQRDETVLRSGLPVLEFLAKRIDATEVRLGYDVQCIRCNEDMHKDLSVCVFMSVCVCVCVCVCVGVWVGVCGFVCVGVCRVDYIALGPRLSSIIKT